MNTIIFNKQLFFGLYKSLLLLFFLESLKTYFFWSIPFVIPALVTAYTIFFYLNWPSFFSFNRTASVVPSFLFALAMLYSIRDLNLNGFIGLSFTLIPIVFVFALKPPFKAEIVVFLTKSLSLLFLISVSFWLLYMCGFPLPSFEVSYGDGQYYYLCHYVYLVSTKSTKIFPRFSFIFLEPGYTAVLLCILLYIKGFQIKRWSGAVFLGSLILTFSLAGYLLCIISFAAYQIKKVRRALIYMPIITIFLVIGFSFFSTYEGGDNPVNRLILERLAFDDGRIAGYNRTLEWFDEYYIRFLHSDNVLLGVGLDAIDLQTNVGYKAYLVLHGVFGLMLLVMAFGSGWHFNRSYDSLFLFVLYMIIFARGHHIIFWFGFLLIYACATDLPQNMRNLVNVHRAPHLLYQRPARVRLVHFAGRFRASGAPCKRLQSGGTCKFTGERLRKLYGYENSLHRT